MVEASVTFVEVAGVWQWGVLIAYFRGACGQNLSFDVSVSGLHISELFTGEGNRSVLLYECGTQTFQ